ERGADRLQRAGVGDRAGAGGAADVIDGQAAGGDLELVAAGDGGGVDGAHPGRGDGAGIVERAAVDDRGFERERRAGVGDIDGAGRGGLAAAVAVVDGDGVEHRLAGQRALAARARGLQRVVAGDVGVVDLERGADRLQRAGVGDRAGAGGAADVIDGQAAGGDLELVAAGDGGGLDVAPPGRVDGAGIVDRAAVDDRG